MIPIQLKLSGFLSYVEPVELDFTAFHLACISGSNGSGKSTLLDAITWSLFQQARKRDESIINLRSTTAEVSFTFSYEENLYRVIRSLTRGKSVDLQFQVAMDHDSRQLISDQSITWRPLTEHSVRETQARIEQVLHLDYDTFINVSFFLQGRADQFTQQPPTKRKEILASILGIEMWDEYRERAATRRKSIERDLDGIDGRLQEIDAELAEESQRKEHLAGLMKELNNLKELRAAQQSALENIRQARAALEKQKELVLKVGLALERASANLAILVNRLETRRSVRATYADVVARASEISEKHQTWQKARKELENWETIASRFREYDKKRQPFLDQINTERVRLEQECSTLEAQARNIEQQEKTTHILGSEIKNLNQAIDELDGKLNARREDEKRLVDFRDQQAELRTWNTGLKSEMDELDVRIKRLDAAEGASCPLCGQPLSQEHRLATMESLREEGTAKATQWRTNRTQLEEISRTIAEYESKIQAFSSLEKDKLRSSSLAAQLKERLETLMSAAATWRKDGSQRLEQVKRALSEESYAGEARQELADIDAELLVLGYDSSAHEALRRFELEGRGIEDDYRTLESARAAIQPLEEEILSLEAQVADLQVDVSRQQEDYEDALASQSAAEASLVDLATAENSLYEIQERENRLSQEVGAARQKVAVLDDLRLRRKRLDADRREYAQQVERYKTLERAFGKDGVPALLIEQALPEIETKANELLDRLSDGAMSIRFVTQSAYKDKKRQDLKETLDILVSDGSGVRDYEMYSGGEAFRTNFAIRLALAEVLASRKGARLQMLVIDEGFGSQDSLGRQRLIQAIRAVEDDFQKILVITHLDELKDAFPHRIEVEKTEAGSTLRIY